MQRLHSLFLIVAILLLLAGMNVSGASQDCCRPSARKAETPATPATVPSAPLSLFSTEGLRKQFNASSQKIRIVALLSPTCPECQSGHAVVGGILKKFPSPRLQA